MFKKSKTQRGQALILIAAAIVGLVAVIALAVDGGNAFMDRRHAQNAADAASLAAALAKVNGQNWTLAGFVRAADNGYANDIVHSTVTLNNPPVAADCDPTDAGSPYIGNNEYIQVIIHSNVDTYFAPVVGITQLHNCVESISRAKPGTTAPMFFGNAVIALNCSACRAFNAHGNATLKTHGGGIFINSSCSSALYSGGSSEVWAPGYTVVGGYSGDFLNEAGTGGGTITVGAAQQACPTTLNIPIPTCSVAGTKVGNNVTPGNIPASYLGNGANLAEGIYCITGSVTINAHDLLKGNNVLLYFSNGSMHINGNAIVQLTGRTSGTYAGLLIYSPLTNHSTFTINGNSDSYFVGSIVALGSHIELLGTGNAEGFHSQIIADTVEYGGTGDGVITYNDSQNYDVPVPPVIEIVQ